MKDSCVFIAFLILLASLIHDSCGKVTYRLYNSRHPAGTSFTTNPVDSRLFERGKGCAFIIHGWTESPRTSNIAYPTDELWRKANLNTITVDWSRFSRTIYNAATNKLKEVGDELALVIFRLHRSNACRVDNTHLIGYSLGAHVAGIAGHRLRTMTGLQVARITGLDPAGPSFHTKALEDKLDRSDAEFVMIIHTSGTLGLQDQLGHADFYPNGGLIQPGCGMLLNTCSHRRSVDYFMESFTNRNAFLSTRCGSYRDFLNNRCQRNDVVPMGLHTPRRARGAYYLETNDRSPYSK